MPAPCPRAHTSAPGSRAPRPQPRATPFSWETVWSRRGTFGPGMGILAYVPFLKQKDPTVPPGQTVTGGFPVLHVGDVPNIDPRTWTLRVFGQVEQPFELT